MPRFQTPRGHLYYETAGHGKCLGLLHGMWSNQGVWKRMVPRLSETHHVVMPDLMGHGRSGRMTVPYRLQTYASDLTSLLDHLGIQEIALAGFSLGGLVAQELCHLQPTRVTSLILIAAPPPQRFSWKIGIGLVSILERLKVTSLKRESIKALRRRQPRSTRKEGVDRSLEGLHEYGDEEFARILRSAWRRSERRPASALKVPTLVMVGEADSIRAHSESLHRSIPGSRLLIVPACGHSVVLDEPALLAEEMLRFLSQASATS